MAKGGARATSGPPPDPNALRHHRVGRENRSDWVHLPAEGRQGETPEWPLTAASKRELRFWAEEWRRPQAVMWEANQQHLEVAIYIRTLGEAEVKNAPHALRTLVRQQQEALGLSLPGLARNRWIIDLPASAKPTAADEPVSRSTTRDRIRAVTRGA